MTIDIRGKHENEDLGMFAMTRKLLGKSATLSMIQKTRIKGREGAARQTLTTAKWSSDHYRLISDITNARKQVEQAMDERRKIIEVAKARQVQSADRFRKIRDVLAEEKGANDFIATATQELLALQQMEADIRDDIKRQRNRAQRTSQRVAWTMAPPGFNNRRGKSLRGPVLGSGPLPPKATGALKNPLIERTIRKYYWDSAGRRHIRDGSENDGNGDSLVGVAMEAIRRAASNISAFKLDLKQIFDQFDTSGDGYLSPHEMAQAFLSMGVQLDIPSMNAIFKYDSLSFFLSILLYIFNLSNESLLQ